MIFLNLLKPTGIDFPIFYDTSGMFWHKLNFYQHLTMSPGPFNYPPTSLLFLWWLGLLPYNLSGLVWNLSSLACLIASIYILLKMAFKKVPKWAFLLCVLLFTIPFFPEKHNLASGQINNFILLLSSLSLYFYSRNRKSTSAALLAFATGIKLVPAIFILYFLIKRDFKTTFIFGLFLLFFAILSTFIVPWDFQKVYYTHVFFQAFPLSGKDFYYNQSLLGFLARSFQQEWLIRTLQYFFSAFLLFLTFLNGRKISELRLISAVACLYLILHPLAWQHHFVLSIIPFIFLTGDFIKSKDGLMGKENWKLFAPLILSYILISWNIKQPDLVPKEFNFLLSHQFFGVLILWALALYKDNFWKLSAVFWIIAISTIYLSFALCRAKICF